MKMRNIIPLVTGGTLLATLFGGSTLHAATKSKPNLVLVLVDDMGWGAFAPNHVDFTEKELNQEFCRIHVKDYTAEEAFEAAQKATPYLNRYCQEGVRFTNAYVTANVSAPSRAGLLTSSYQQRYGLYIIKEAETGIPTTVLTMPQVMKDYGYANGAFGKYHNGKGMDENTSAGLIAWVLMALAALTLFVASMNYVLISISTLVSRSKTIAMLKVGGARSSDIFRIFCSETAILTFASVIVAGFLLWALQDQVLEITGTPMSELFALKRIWVPLLVILAAFALAALIPSRIFTSVPVTLAFRGVSDNRRRWKQTLLVAEIVSCTFTLTLLLLAVLQFDKLRNGDFGFEHDRIVYTYVKTPLGNISSVCDAVASLPEVDAAGASLEVPLWGYSGMPCIDENSKELLFSCRWLLCNEGFIPAMRMHLVGGRNFTPSSNPLEAIVNETYVRMRGWTPEQALGHQITDDSSPGAPLYTIVGVVKDFRTVVATGEVEPIVFHPFSYFQKFGATDDYMLDYSMMIRLRGMSPESLEAVQRKIGEYPSGNNHTLEVYDNKLGPILFEIRSFRNIVFTVSGITLLIALMGLVGYLGDEMRRRSKEIALRKVNGASTADVLRLLARDVLWIAVPSVVVGAAVSRWGADLLVSNFVERVALRWWLFALCGAVVLLIVCTVQLVRTWRIANANPINMIKTE